MRRNIYIFTQKAKAAEAGQRLARARQICWGKDGSTKRYPEPGSESSLSGTRLKIYICDWVHGSGLCLLTHHHGATLPVFTSTPSKGVFTFCASLCSTRRTVAGLEHVLHTWQPVRCHQGPDTRTAQQPHADQEESASRPKEKTTSRAVPSPSVSFSATAGGPSRTQREDRCPCRSPYEGQWYVH